MAIGLQLLVQLGDARGEGVADETLSGFDRRSHPMGALVRLPQHVARPGEVALIGGQCHAPCESCRETQRRSPDGCGKAQCGCHSGGYGLIWVRLFWSDLIVPVRTVLLPYVVQHAAWPGSSSPPPPARTVPGTGRTPLPRPSCYCAYPWHRSFPTFLSQHPRTSRGGALQT